MENKYPFNDSSMVYDFKSHHYVLTKQGVLDELNINLDVELNTAMAANTAGATEMYLKRVSTFVYNYLTQFNRASTIEYIIAKCPSAREIIKEALKLQLVYFLSVGDLSLSAEKEHRELIMDSQCKMMLNNQEVEETGVVLTYIGRYMFRVPSYEKGDF